MSQFTYLRSYKNKSYINEFVVPFLGEDQRYRYVYKITNMVNNKIYVGQHMVAKHLIDPIKDNYKGSGIILKALRQKYNWYRDFKFEIIEFCENSFQLNLREMYWIDYYKSIYGKTCCNIATGGKGGATENAKRNAIAANKEKYQKIWQSQSEQKSKRVLVVFDFVSPLNGKYFASGTIFKNAYDASIQLGYACKTAVAVLMCRKYHPGQWYVKQKGARSGYKFITAFVYIDNNFNQDNLAEIQNQQLTVKHKFYDSIATSTNHKICKLSQTKSRSIVCLTSFTSPLNQKTFTKGTVFKTAALCSNALGFKQNSFVNIMRHKNHKGEWYHGYGRKRQFVARFAYIDQLT